MKRRRTAESESESQHRWLVSYSDFITLLFAFFVVMFASNQSDRKKVGAAVRKAFNGEQPKTVQILGGTVNDLGPGNRMMKGPGGAEMYTPAPKSDELLPSQEFLSRELASEIQDGKLSIHMEQRGMVVSLSEAGYFVSGSDQLSPELYPVLEKIAATVLKAGNPMRLEGHTDSIPIHSTRFRSNWELSTARAIAMLEAFRTRFQVPVKGLEVAGYADTFPLESNDTPEGRSKNRRVDVVILSRSAVELQPQRASASAPAPPEVPSAIAAPAAPNPTLSR